MTIVHDALSLYKCHEIYRKKKGKTKLDLTRHIFHNCFVLYKSFFVRNYGINFIKIHVSLCKNVTQQKEYIIMIKTYLWHILSYLYVVWYFPDAAIMLYFFFFPFLLMYINPWYLGVGENHVITKIQLLTYWWYISHYISYNFSSQKYISLVKIIIYTRICARHKMLQRIINFLLYKHED